MNDLVLNLDRLHTTDMGARRIARNLNICAARVVTHCRRIIVAPSALHTRRGKNWYVVDGDVTLTINAGTYTIITAHRRGCITRRAGGAYPRKNPTA